MCTHFMEFDSFYRAGIYRRPCTSDRCEFFGNFMKLAKKYLTDSITKKTAKIKRTESKRFSLKCHIINKGVRVRLKNISLRIIKSELEGISMRLCNYCVIAESDRYFQTSSCTIMNQNESLKKIFSTSRRHSG